MPTKTNQEARARIPRSAHTQQTYVQCKCADPQAVPVPVLVYEACAVANFTSRYCLFWSANKGAVWPFKLLA